ncbi:MAG: NfeD family protein [Porticoccaceae bacterium]|tara:strand:+ start:134 stop:406 length:273 start_codon:yes stop_codon:yes gene_type:complete
MINYFLNGEGWLLVGLVLIAIEIFAPGYIFLAFGIGSILTFALIEMGFELTLTMNGFVDSLLLCSLMSLVALVILKKIFNKKDDSDINEY